MLTVFLGFLTGIGIFLYGTHLLGNGLQQLGASKMRKSLAMMTNTKLKAIFSGILVTFFLQSSTVTNILVVGLVGESLISLVQAFGVVLGAAIGTTLTVQILTFDISEYSAIFIFFGVVFIMFIKSSFFKSFGQILLSVGFVFFGIGVITNSLEPLSHNQNVLNFLINLSESPLLFFVIGIVFTALMHSSAAMIIIGIAFVSSGVLSLNSVLPLVLGANVGDTLPVLISSFSTQAEGKKLALFNMIFKTIGALIILFSLSFISDWVDLLPGDPERQIAHFHTLLNIVIVIIFFPLLNVMVKFLNRLLPTQVEDSYLFEVTLNERLLTVPEEALNSSKKKVVELASYVNHDMINKLSGYMNNEVRKEELEETEKVIDNNYVIIQQYLLKLGQKNLTNQQSNEEVKLLNILNDIEHIGDIVIRFVSKAEQIRTKNINISYKDIEQLNQLIAYIESSYSKSIEAFQKNDMELARKNIQYQSLLNQFEKDIKFKHFNELISNQENNPDISAVYLDIINQLMQVYNHSQNISRTVLGLI